MAKIFQDIKKKKIVIKQLQKKPDLEVKVDRPKLKPKDYQVNFSEKKAKGGKRYMIWFVVLVSVVFFFFSLSFFFSKATITIYPKTKDIVLNENFLANKDDTTNNLPFELVAISGEESKLVKAGEKKEVSKKAEGVVFIYNMFSLTPQNLAIDTRLEGSNGKIYKTKNKITIPGMTKAGIPGKVEVSVYAMNAGAEYNSKPIDFKIAGFKGTAKYSKIYGRSKGDIVGGFKGEVNQISDSDKTLALSELEIILKDKLLKKAISQIPNGFVLFKDASFLSEKESVLGDASLEGNSTFTLKGTLYGFLFDEKKITKKIVSSVEKKYDGSDVYILDIRNLKFNLSDKENISFVDVASINFNLSGNTKIVWKFNEVSFVNELMGKSKKDFQQIMSKYQNVSSSNLVIRPFWRMSFPEASKKIKVIVNYPK